MVKKDIFYYTKKKITILSTAIVFLCLVIFSITTALVYNSKVFENVDREIFKQKSMLKDIISISIKDNKSVFEKDRGMKPPPINPRIIVMIYSGESVEFISPNPYFDKNNVPETSSLSEDVITQIEYNDYKFRGLIFNNIGYKILLLANVDSETQSMEQLNNSIILSLVVLLIVSVVLATFLANRIVKPVRKAYDKQVFFVQDASHEMRTPLAIIKGKLELLANAWGETIEDNFEHISKMMSEIRGLEKLNSDLLLLTKEDLGVSIKIEDVSLKDFTDDISEFYIDLAEMQNKEFKVINPHSDLMVKWDYHKMKRAVIILLENAFKYTPEEGKITLSFEDLNKFIKIRVCDTGIGIKKEDQLRIFDRFFRSANIRSSNIAGSGVGLSLLKSISKTLGFTVKFSSQVGKGTDFELIVSKIMK
ncbi:sensor histidine kinase [Clostridium brassicae]|uniref:histidine kinase n=1 Tax=Clostridium brassicae TaxID=2999072 RepID=A0ABT4DC14_9CLOT|nr:HAMP domain-containing sensor histidine kinase [Clostridium brassicae]MCY6959850.1 HAMP domain-containing sensor histidine kinase [Clostridium brassicae]